MDDWLLVALEEYKTLRDEGLQAIQNQLFVLRLGALALGFLLASISPLLQFKELLAYLELTLFYPIVIALITIIWTGEVGRMIRAGNYISALEKEINDRLKKNNKLEENEVALYWEQWLRKEGKQTRFTYIFFCCWAFRNRSHRYRFCGFPLAFRVFSRSKFFNIVSFTGSW
ncbi:MAG: hypothetical protein ACK4WF_03930 [Candidatus Brocadiales bacterium]